MSTALNQNEIQNLQDFFQNCLRDPDSMSHEQLVSSIKENQEPCSRALTQIKNPPGEITIEDVNFLISWLKARNLIIGGLQLLQMADPENAAAIQHEVECTETAFTLLPGLLNEARERLQ